MDVGLPPAPAACAVTRPSATHSQCTTATRMGMRMNGVSLSVSILADESQSGRKSNQGSTSAGAGFAMVH